MKNQRTDNMDRNDILENIGVAFDLLLESAVNRVVKATPCTYHRIDVPVQTPTPSLAERALSDITFEVMVCLLERMTKDEVLNVLHHRIRS